MSEYADPGDPLMDPEPRVGRRRTDVQRVRGPGLWIMVGILAAFLAGVVAISLFTQTGWGREKVLAFTLRTLGGRLNGQLTIERLEGNVITGARLYDVALTDTAGVPLAQVDSLFIQYRIATLLGGDIVITRLDIHDAEVNLFRMPGDTIWNYSEILSSPHPDTTAARGAILIQRMSLERTGITVGTPLEGDPRLSPAARKEKLEEIIADSARFNLQEVPGGRLRLSHFNVEQAGFVDLFIGPDERGGTYLEVTEGRADVRLWKDPPLRVEDLRGRLQLQEGLVALEFPQAVLPHSTGEVVGRIDLRGERPLYDLVIRAPRFTLADLRWLYPWLPEEPEEGRGSANLWVEDRDEELVVIARELELELPGTRISGEFGLLIGLESLRFVDVDLEADPLRIESVERLLPTELPVRGLVVGGATIRGEE